MTTFRRRIGDVYVTATSREDGSWDVITTDAFYRPVDGPARTVALDAVLLELSSLRGHIWSTVLGRPSASAPPSGNDAEE